MFMREPIIQMEKWRHNRAVCPHFQSKGGPGSEFDFTDREFSPGQPDGRLKVGVVWSGMGAGS